MRFTPVLPVTLLFGLCILLAAPQALADEWMDAPGVVVYDSDDGQLVEVPFTHYLTRKHAFFHLHDGNKRMRIHIRHPKRIVLYDVDDPVLVELRNGEFLEGTTKGSFIRALTDMDTFTFRAANPVLQRTTTYTVPAGSVRSLSFR